MAPAPSLRGIPFYSGIATDSSGFAPVYDPRAIRFARKVNFAIGTVIGLAALGLTLLFFTSEPITAANAARVPGDFGDTVTAALLNFALPIFFVTVGFLLILFVTPRIGFDLPRAYSATADALRAWLPSTAGEYPEPKENPIEELKENFATGEDSLRFILDADGNSFLQEAAKGIARQSTEALELFSKDQRASTLSLDATGRYQLTMD